jgi:hypothetical protein
LSSTTDRRRAQEGQVLVLFAGGLITLLLFAALAFDGGMVLAEHRDQQDAADASALGGARYLDDDPTDVSGQVSAAAFNIASANGYTDGLEGESVVVNIPPTSGPNAGREGFIEVIISSVEPSLFARVIGLLNWDVGARAVATNGAGGGANFAMLALDPEGCGALSVTGTGTVNSYGNIQVNSVCPDDALHRTGGGVINIFAEGAACNVAGGIKDQGGGSLNCLQNEGAQALTDPLGSLPEPQVPAYPAPPLQVGGTPHPNGIPKGCQGTVDPNLSVPPPPSPVYWYPAATWDEPATCRFDSSYQNTTWRLYPGYYPGGLVLQGGTYYLEPGIYFLGGGGMTYGANGVTVRSVASGGTSLDFGVLFYNTEAQDVLYEDPAIPDEFVHAWCQDLWAWEAGGGSAETFPNPDPAVVPADDPANPYDPADNVNEYTQWFQFRCAEILKLNGSGVQLDLYPLKLPVTGTCADVPVPDSCFNGLVFYQNRFLNIPGDDLQLNGSDTGVQVRGTIYVPFGEVKVNGSGAGITLDQVIAYDFKITGSGGTVNVMNDQDFVFQLASVGLVE